MLDELEKEISYMENVLRKVLVVIQNSQMEKKQKLNELRELFQTYNNNIMGIERLPTS